MQIKQEDQRLSALVCVLFLALRVNSENARVLSVNQGLLEMQFADSAEMVAIDCKSNGQREQCRAAHKRP